MQIDNIYHSRIIIGAFCTWLREVPALSSSWATEPLSVLRMACFGIVHDANGSRYAMVEWISMSALFGNQLKRNI